MFAFFIKNFLVLQKSCSSAKITGVRCVLRVCWALKSAEVYGGRACGLHGAPSGYGELAGQENALCAPGWEVCVAEVGVSGEVSHGVCLK